MSNFVTSIENAKGLAPKYITRINQGLSLQQDVMPLSVHSNVFVGYIYCMMKS